MMLSSTNAKAKGNISSVFAHLGASTTKLDPRFVTLKKDICKTTDVLQASYDRLISKFEEEKKEIQAKGSSVIPEIHINDIKNNGGRLPDAVAALVKKRGCLVVRGLLDRTVAMQYKADIKQYIDNNRDVMVGYPQDQPQVWELYWTKAQAAARAHPHFDIATLAINQLWHGHPDTPIDLSKNLTYCDRLRIRVPGDENFALAEHVDGGSLERWEDPEYRKCYEEIFKGHWENFDPFDVTHRIEAEMDLYDAPGGCSMFRLFQGWVSLSDITPGGGTLRVCPLIKEQTAYYMMKPLLEDHKDQADFMGAWPGRCQDISATHHRPIIDTMVSLPTMQYGDGVFWHCDQVHAVEPKNEMKTEDSSVLYIPSTPMCRRNTEYLKRQRACFLAGITPPDFPGNNTEQHINERATPESLDTKQKIGMGLLPFSSSSLDDNSTPGQRQALKQHNDILGF
ncbi:uncharacterized protein BX664DRAFT_303559 [Halteromyces radiatus]|uniref:uncharacterized protein n=1 Tax=Halteromyces radiatus TaxID=101107 RepID=UPI00221FBE58|nr:uncharacterized protein BX664DRAFT_303559 [Halteromyces radiatus]KAI8078763.1 hypothetical protein BX664DRAFT_303559 [Halteromyces radiatus]